MERESAGGAYRSVIHMYPTKIAKRAVAVQSFLFLISGEIRKKTVAPSRPIAAVVAVMCGFRTKHDGDGR